MCLFLGAVDHGFEPWWSKTKENKIDISFFSAKSKTGWVGIGQYVQWCNMTTFELLVLFPLPINLTSRI
jgi:hypothetical protein